MVTSLSTLSFLISSIYNNLAQTATTDIINPDITANIFNQLIPFNYVWLILQIMAFSYIHPLLPMVIKY